MIHTSLDGLPNADVCVVGAGPAGIALSVELERQGHRVLLLESGGHQSNHAIQALSDAHFVNPDAHDDMQIAVARRLGGTSNLWAGRCIKYDRIDLAPRPELLTARWPISYEELLPFYARACALVDCGEAVFEAPLPGLHQREGAFTFTTLERWANEQKLQVTHGEVLKVSRTLDIRLFTTLVDIHFKDNGDVAAIEVVNGDSPRRRRISVKRLVIATGGLESTRMLLVVRHKVPGAMGGPEGPLGRHYMGHLVGEIADISFDDETLDQAFDYFIDGYGSYVRRRLRPSDEVQARERILNVAMWPIVPPIADARHKSAVLSFVYLLLSSDRLGRIFIAEAIRRRHIPVAGVPLGGHLRNLIFGLPSALAFAVDFLIRRYMRRTRLPGFFLRNAERRYRLAYHSEQRPIADSRVVLSEDRDALGVPKLLVNLKFSEADAQSVVRAHELLAEWLQSTGLGHLEYLVSEPDRIASVMRQARHGTHQIGTARMGASGDDGIVDRDLRVFGTKGLFVLSSAVLPTSSQANPTLTVMALAARLAETIGLEVKLEAMRDSA